VLSCRAAVRGCTCPIGTLLRDLRDRRRQDAVPATRTTPVNGWSSLSRPRPPHRSRHRRAHRRAEAPRARL